MPVRARIGRQRSCDFVDAELTPAEGRRAGRAREAAWAEERGTDVRGSEPPSHRSSGAVDTELAPAESPQAGTRSGTRGGTDVRGPEPPSQLARASSMLNWPLPRVGDQIPGSAWARLQGPGQDGAGFFLDFG